MPSISKFEQSRALPTSVLAQSVISVLHDHDKLMRCQPLVGQVEDLRSAPECAQPDEQTSEHRWFRQTEYVPFLPFGIWKKKVVFQNYFKDLPDTPVPQSANATTTESSPTLVEGGVESKVYVPGLQIKAVFKVVKRKPDPRKDTLRRRDRNEKADEIDGGWKIVEETEMTCKNAMVKWVSVSQHRKAQKEMLNRIVFEAKKRAYGVQVADAES